MSPTARDRPQRAAHPAPRPGAARPAHRHADRAHGAAEPVDRPRPAVRGLRRHARLDAHGAGDGVPVRLLLDRDRRLRDLPRARLEDVAAPARRRRRRAGAARSASSSCPRGCCSSSTRCSSASASRSSASRSTASGSPSRSSRWPSRRWSCARGLAAAAALGTVQQLNAVTNLGTMLLARPRRRARPGHGAAEVGPAGVARLAGQLGDGELPRHDPRRQGPRRHRSSRSRRCSACRSCSSTFALWRLRRDAPKRTWG